MQWIVNKIGEDGFRALDEAMKHNTTLTELSLASKLFKCSKKGLTIIILMQIITQILRITGHEMEGFIKTALINLLITITQHIVLLGAIENTSL